MRAAYIIGEPGSGKSTLVRALTEGIDRERRSKPFAHTVYRRDGRTVAAQLGAEHPTFPGTDRLSMSVQPAAIEWLMSAPAPFVLGEGDRLATGGFFGALTEWTDGWTLIHLETPPETAAARRAERGSEQSEAWLKGRQTKVAKLVSLHRGDLVVLDGSRPVAELVAQVAVLPGFGWVHLGKQENPKKG